MPISALYSVGTTAAASAASAALSTAALPKLPAEPLPDKTSALAAATFAVSVCAIESFFEKIPLTLSIKPPEFSAAATFSTCAKLIKFPAKAITLPKPKPILACFNLALFSADGSALKSFFTSW